jgi:hypothetical protein
MTQWRKKHGHKFQSSNRPEFRFSVRGAQGTYQTEGGLTQMDEVQPHAIITEWLSRSQVWLHIHQPMLDSKPYRLTAA